MIVSGIPERGRLLVDRHLEEGRAGATAIECGDRRISHGELHEQVNRVGTALRERLGVRPEERVLLLMLDSPEMIYSFFRRDQDRRRAGSDQHALDAR